MEAISRIIAVSWSPALGGQTGLEKPHLFRARRDPEAPLIVAFHDDGKDETRALTEVAPHSARIAEIVVAHNKRLRNGFRRALVNTTLAHGVVPDRTITAGLATLLVVFANGLWSTSRSVVTATPLRSAVREQLHLIAQRIIG